MPVLRRSNGTAAGRAWTLSIAVPGSIIDNTQNTEFATFVAGQVARTAAIFNVDEASETPFTHLETSQPIHKALEQQMTAQHAGHARSVCAVRVSRECGLQVVVIDEEPKGDDSVSAGAAFLARVLQYQETPQYLRK